VLRFYRRLQAGMQASVRCNRVVNVHAFLPLILLWCDGNSSPEGLTRKFTKVDAAFSVLQPSRSVK
jgi:hypothetical protein